MYIHIYIYIHTYISIDPFMGRARAQPRPMCWALSEGPSDGRPPGPSDGRPRGPRTWGGARPVPCP